MKPILIVYHCLFQIGDELLPAALSIVQEQMEALRLTGLLRAASHMIVGVNGGEESRVYAESLLPEKAEVLYHGLQCRTECRTIEALHKWTMTHPNWNVLYFHSKGATHADGLDEYSISYRWRRCMMNACVVRWRECVAYLEGGKDAVGAHWQSGLGCDGTQHYFAGTFFWATSNYLRSLPSIQSRDRIRISGIDSEQSRWEAEVWIGNGSKRPKVKDLMPGHSFMRCP